MRHALAVLLVVATPVAAQTTITPSQTTLIGCFGDAFTIVEHVWRIAPAHLEFAAAESARPPSDQRGQRLEGIVASGVQVDQASATAALRNLDGCITKATEETTADATTAILATAVRIELDSALEDVDALIRQTADRRETLRQAWRGAASDRTLDSPLDTYLAFGDTVKRDLLRLRARTDALIAAATAKR